jgi:hypothetical protein
MLFVGVDWAEAHHDLCLLDEQGKCLVGGGCRMTWKACGGSTS